MRKNAVIQRNARALSGQAVQDENRMEYDDDDDDAVDAALAHVNNDGDGSTIAVHTAVVAVKETQGAQQQQQHQIDDTNLDNQAQDKKIDNSNNSIRIKDLKLLWLLFQCLWPAVLIIFCDYYITLPKLLAPYVLTFWLVAYAIKGNIIREFVAWDFCPSAIWMAIYIIGEDGVRWIVLLLIVLAFLMGIILGPRKAWELGCKNICQGLKIKLSGKFDSFERWVAKLPILEAFPRPEDYDGKDDDEEGAKNNEEIKIQNLEYLEDLSKRGKLKKPTWVLVVLCFLIVWQVGFLFFFINGMPKDWLHPLNYEGGWIGKISNVNVHKALKYDSGPTKLRAANRAGQMNDGFLNVDGDEPLHAFRGNVDEHAVELTAATFENFLNDHEVAFIHWYAPWAIWCQRLYPRWENFAKTVRRSEVLGVGKVNCVTNSKLCGDHRVMAFPTLRWYEDGEAIKPDYTLERTVHAFVRYTKQKLSQRMSDDAWLEQLASEQSDISDITNII